MSSNTDTVTSSEHLLGRVKWFNNKAGYGFITVTDGSRSGTDIFVHHSAINVESQQYKYLVQGEYVEFDLVNTNSEKHEWQASLVSGVKGGKLMCETRHELKVARTEYKTTATTKRSEEPVAEAKTPRQRVPRESIPKQRKTTAPRLHGEGPRDEDKKEWTLVAGKDKPKRAQNVKKTSGKNSTVVTIQSK